MQDIDDNFNSIKVRLEPSVLRLTMINCWYFNSIKVRLERVLCRQFNQFVVFQFHKGTIRTDLSHNDVFSCAPFQFHKGTIRTPKSDQRSESAARFQFHKGTIRTSRSFVSS